MEPVIITGSTMAKSAQLGEYHVLHIDDDQAFLDITNEFLDRSLTDTTIHSTTDITQAQTLLESGLIGCIVSDYEMPGTTGLEFLEIVRGEYQDLPFILYTGKGSEEIASKAVNAGVTGYLQKGGPDQHRRLGNRVEHAITEYRAQVESQRYSTVLEALGYPVYVVDEAERFTYINDAFVELAGYSREELIGSQPSLIKADESVKRVNEIVPTLISSTGPDIERLEIEIQPRDGPPIPCKDHITALPFDEEFQGCAGILRDMSAQRQRQDALARKNERLEELVSVISHDLQTPLATARTAATLASETGSPSHFEQLKQAHKRIEQMLEEVMTLAQEGEQIIAAEAVQLDTAAREAWKVVDTAASSLEVSLEMAIEADPGRLQRLFENLFTNAVIHAGPEVTVTVAPLSSDQTGFCVRDNGPGIPADRHDAVFEPGFSTADGGTGFGLAIIDRIAAAHGWGVSVSHGPAGGAQFEFTDVSESKPYRAGSSA